MPRHWVSGKDGNCIRQIKKNTYKRQRLDKDGYCRVSLSKKGKKSSYRTHRLVLETFVGPCPKGHETRHKDGDPANNRLDNLCWGTPKENAKDRGDHGWVHPLLGKKHSKETKEKMREARRKWWENKRKEAATDE